MSSKTLACLAFTAAALISTAASAQFAATWSHGPSIPMYSIRWDENGQATSALLAEGAGYSFNANMLPSADGRWRYLTVGVPFFMQVPSSNGLGFSMGLTFGTFNNLLALGAVVDMAKMGDVDSGLLVGNFSKQNVGLLVSFNLNFGTGQKEAPAQASKAYARVTYDKGGEVVVQAPPPGYVKFW